MRKLKHRRRRYPEIEFEIVQALEQFGPLSIPEIFHHLRGRHPPRAVFDSLYRLEEVGGIHKEKLQITLSAPPPPPHTPISQNDREGQLLGN
ncbi:hypothetical protein [Synechocystis sp. PCC 6803]|uniref:hypothetical protein n=1 Tax=Synechocystis sp. PCC 6803 TaxID=1148 RepID=UPI0002B6616B|nr:hypothetical protein [Synechocystis sp. PCC 6803]AGF53828.1 hypothetical protein MYO_650 [Synechocystis sp. PCC 6803]MCW5242643.1 hypothetical protein [Synechocystis sp. PCC 6803]NHM00417.1 hypothetical protein [Synechocystis sp. PCC 6803]